MHDTGPGISAADQGKIFEEFQQADNSSTKKKGGTGLGPLDRASASSRCTAASFGSSPSSGKGSTFSFNAAGQGRTQQVRHTHEQMHSCGRGSEDNRQILRDLLGHAGYNLVEAEDGEEALAAVAKQRPDLILMDIQLPVMDGYEATRRIKADPALRQIPIIAVTSYALSGDEAKARAAGCDAYVAKPFSPRQLLAKVREFLP